ncbi:glycosyltransferase [Flavobacterium poyangense]|uniref:glycosyltransferase n=1 Tax=Flavobacterium poyangense TaxID=2204302 RepID=UPI00141DFC5B|nr:glycosyltransferase [Flavobacterium sp. JXAS1]
MKILLVGEYSRLHNSLKEGLVKHGHTVKIVSNSNGFRNFPVDYSIDYTFCKLRFVHYIRQLVHKITKFDIVNLEQGLRFYFLLNQFKGYDVVQFINERPIITTKKFELFLVKKIFNTNKKVFVLSCGVDYLTLQYDLSNKDKKSLIQPYLQDSGLHKYYKYIEEYFTPNYKKIHDFVLKNCNGIIVTDLDYIEANQPHPKFRKLIPYPINHDILPFEEPIVHNKVIIFLGVNQYSYYQKGINYFEAALAKIALKYPDRVEIIRSQNVPYAVYINSYNKSHILLDQAFTYDQGYNALEAMAKSKVVFTGAETEFTAYYKITERVCINAIPDVDYLVNELSFLIENPQEIIAIGKRARAFIEEEHDYVKIAQQYLDVWK